MSPSDKRSESMRRIPPLRLCFALRSWLHRPLSLVASMRLRIGPGDKSLSPLRSLACPFWSWVAPFVPGEGSREFLRVDLGDSSPLCSTMICGAYISSAGILSFSRISSKARSSLTIVAVECCWDWSMSTAFAVATVICRRVIHLRRRRRHREQSPMPRSLESHLTLSFRQLMHALPLRESCTEGYDGEMALEQCVFCLFLLGVSTSSWFVVLSLAMATSS